MKYLHTMVRVRDPEASLKFYCDALGLKEIRRYDNEAGRFTLIFLATEEGPKSSLPTTGTYRKPTAMHVTSVT